MNNVVKGVVCLAAGSRRARQVWPAPEARVLPVASDADASVPVFGILTGVAATSARNAWAVGQVNAFGKNLILHWNGTRWKRVLSPSPLGAQLYGVAATCTGMARRGTG